MTIRMVLVFLASIVRDHDTEEEWANTNNLEERWVELVSRRSSGLIASILFEMHEMSMREEREFFYIFFLIVSDYLASLVVFVAFFSIEIVSERDTSSDLCTDTHYGDIRNSREVCEHISRNDSSAICEDHEISSSIIGLSEFGKKRESSRNITSTSDIEWSDGRKYFFEVFSIECPWDEERCIFIVCYESNSSRPRLYILVYVFFREIESTHRDISRWAHIFDKHRQRWVEDIPCHMLTSWRPCIGEENQSYTSANTKKWSEPSTIRKCTKNKRQEKKD